MTTRLSDFVESLFTGRRGLVRGSLNREYISVDGPCAFENMLSIEHI